MSEDERIRKLTEVLARGPAGSDVRVGIGDDAAVVLDGVVLTVDTHVEDVHFRRAWLSFEELGHRSFMAAASDIAAMGARPTFALSSLILPPEITDADVIAIGSGQARAAGAIGATVVGGNVSRGPLSITTTVLGHGASPLLRSGAKPGDLLLLGGAVGLAAAGLSVLMRGLHDADDLVAAWRSPRAHVELGAALVAASAHACIDVSDGLALDLHRMCEKSGVGAEVSAKSVLASTPALSLAAARVGLDALELALYGGEDYALLATAPGEIQGFAVIGRITEDTSVMLSRDDDTGGRERAALRALPRRGFQHF